MKTVTDPELIKRLREKQSEASVNNPVGLVTDENVISRLKKKKENLAKTSSDPQLSKPKETSVVQEGSPFDVLSAGADVLLTTGTSIIAEPLAGLYGLAALAGTGGDPNKAAEAVESAREALSFTPKTEQGRKALATVGDYLAPVAEGIETASAGIGDTVYEWTGSPELAAVAYSLPTAALEAAGIKGLRGVNKLADADIRKAQRASLNDPDLKYSGSVAEVKLNNKGQLVDDKIGSQLVKGGVRENDVAVITNSTKSTKSQMKDMVKIFEEGRGNDVLGMATRTTKPIGKSITNRLQSLSTKRKVLGRRLQQLTESEVGDTKVNVMPSLGGIAKVLRDEGVKPVMKPNGTVGLPDDWYKGTSFDLSKMSGARRAIEDAFKLIESKTNAGNTTLREAHKIKKNLDEYIDAAKLSESGVPAQTLRQISEMRKVINNTLSEVPEYRAINRDLSEIISVMAPFEKFLPAGKTWQDAKVTSVVGESLRQLANDSKTAVNMVEDLSNIERYMRKANMSFGDDPRALIQFRQALMENFNVTPTSPNASMFGAAGSLAASAGIGNTFGAAHDTAKLIRAGLAKKKAAELANQNKKNFNLIKAAISQ